jgi:hypothetical protein
MQKGGWRGIFKFGQQPSSGHPTAGSRSSYRCMMCRGQYPYRINEIGFVKYELTSNLRCNAWTRNQTCRRATWSGSSWRGAQGT